MNLTATNKQMCVSRNAKTLGLQHLQILDMGASSGQPDWACVVCHRTEELLKLVLKIATHNLVCTKKITQHFVSTNSIWLMLFSEIIVVCRENRTKSINAK
jgi:hypothetical protein